MYAAQYAWRAPPLFPCIPPIYGRQHPHGAIICIDIVPRPLFPAELAAAEAVETVVLARACLSTASAKYQRPCATRLICAE